MWAKLTTSVSRISLLAGHQFTPSVEHLLGNFSPKFACTQKVEYTAQPTPSNPITDLFVEQSPPGSHLILPRALRDQDHFVEGETESQRCAQSQTARKYQYQDQPPDYLCDQVASCPGPGVQV